MHVGDNTVLLRSREEIKHWEDIISPVIKGLAIYIPFMHAIIHRLEIQLYRSLALVILFRLILHLLGFGKITKDEQIYLIMSGIHFWIIFDEYSTIASEGGIWDDKGVDIGTFMINEDSIRKRLCRERRPRRLFLIMTQTLERG